MSIVNKNNLEIIIVSLLPFSLIIGPAVAEIFLLFLAFILIVNKDNLNLYTQKKIINITIIFFLLIFLTNLLNFIVSDYENIISLIKGTFFLRFLILIFLFSLIFQNLKKLEFFFFVVMSIIIFLISDTLVQEFFGKDFFGYEKLNNGRLSGPFKNEYIIGGVLLKFLIIFNLCFNLLYKELTLKKKILWFLINIFCLITILFSKERSSIILGIFYILWMLLFLNFFTKKNKIILFSLSIFFISTVFLVNKTLSKKFNDSFILIKNIVSNEKGSIPGYYAHFYSAIEIYKENKLIGSGIKQYRVECKKFLTKETILKKTIFKNFTEKQKNNFNKNICTTHPHYYLLEILAETGIIVLIFYIFLVFYILTKSFINFFPIIFVIFIPFVPTGSFFNNFNSFFIWIIFSLLLASLPSSNDKKNIN